MQLALIMAVTRLLQQEMGGESLPNAPAVCACRSADNRKDCSQATPVRDSLAQSNCTGCAA